MQENCLFEYAVIRVVPRVEREEFMNVGVILYCPSQKFLGCIYSLNKERLYAMDCNTDPLEVEKNLLSLTKICKGEPEGGAIGRLTLVSRFRWLTATRSTILQSSSVHLGLTNDPQKTLESLHKKMVC